LKHVLVIEKSRNVVLVSGLNTGKLFCHRTQFVVLLFRILHNNVLPIQNLFLHYFVAFFALKYKETYICQSDFFFFALQVLTAL